MRGCVKRVHYRVGWEVVLKGCIIGWVGRLCYEGALEGGLRGCVMRVH